MKTELVYIVEGCQKKEPMAQKLLYEKFAPSMLGVCMRYTHSRDEAQDLLHDGFIKVFERIGHLHNPMAVSSWMYKIMVNTCLNYITRNSQLQYYDMSDMENGENQQLLVDDTQIEEDGYTMDEIVHAIQELPDTYRTVFNMREVEEMKFSEIAETLGMNESSIRSVLTRARRMLRNKLSKIKNNKI